MSESTATSPAGEIEAPETVVEMPFSLDGDGEAAEGAAPPEEIEDDLEAEPEPPAAEPEPVEEIEFDLGGTALKVPKDAKVADVAEQIATWTKAAQAAHTQRSQVLADQRRAVEATFEEAQKFRRMSEGVAENFATGRALLSQVQADEAALANGQLWQTDPDRARMISDRVSATRRQLDQTIQALSAEEQALEHAERQRADASARQVREQTERQAEEGRKIVQAVIPKFDAEGEAKLIAYAVKQGIPEHEAKIWSLNPISAIAFHKAMLWDEAKVAAKPVKEPLKPPAAPIKGMPGNAASSVPSDPTHMSNGQLHALLKGRGVLR